VFTPFRAAGDDRMRRWTRESYETFRHLASTAADATGVTVGPLRELFFHPQPGDPWWTDLVQGARRLANVPAGYVDGWEAWMPRMRMLSYMPWLERRFVNELGGQIVTQRVREFADLFSRGFNIVINCAGLGARELADDPNVCPMRGQVLHVANTLGLNEALAEEGRGAITTYIFPFQDYVVLGGTYERDEWSESTSESDLAAIVERCRDLLRACGHADWRRMGEQRLRALAGLRPARVIGGIEEAVRLEREAVGADRFIIHNYGHGRTGVTLSWGCAAEVVRLVEEVTAL